MQGTVVDSVTVASGDLLSFYDAWGEAEKLLQEGDGGVISEAGGLLSFYDAWAQADQAETEKPQEGDVDGVIVGEDDDSNDNDGKQWSRSWQ